jgi:hypothetical protein
VRTQQKLDALIAELTANCGDMYEACKSTGMSLQFVSQWRKDDSKTDAEIREAINLGTMRIESAAIKRAVEGVEEDIYYQGDIVGSKTVYSDGLHALLLKGRMAEVYGKDAGNSNTFNGPTQINVMPRAEDYSQWLEMKRLAETKALPAPENDVIDAVFSPVPDRITAFEGLGL